MKRLGLIGLMLITVCAFGGITATSSLAVECRLTREIGAGVYKDSQCIHNEAPFEFVKVLGHTKYLGNGIWCVETELNLGNRTDPQCGIKGVGKYIEVLQPGPNWRVNGNQLKQGTKQIKLQLKGTAVLKTPLLSVEIECKNSISEGATIEGQGEAQGQGKGRVSYTQCTVLKPSACTVAQPITTNQLKSHIAFASTQTKMVQIFEPTVGVTFVVLKFSGASCPASVLGERGVIGSIAAELTPVGKESQEGLVAFPSSAITTVLYEGQERKLKLEVGGFPSTFSAVYGARLATNEPFGVFEH